MYNSLCFFSFKSYSISLFYIDHSYFDAAFGLIMTKVKRIVWKNLSKKTSFIHLFYFNYENLDSVAGFPGIKDAMNLYWMSEEELGEVVVKKPKFRSDAELVNQLLQPTFRINNILIRNKTFWTQNNNSRIPYCRMLIESQNTLCIIKPDFTSIMQRMFDAPSNFFSQLIFTV